MVLVLITSLISLYIGWKCPFLYRPVCGEVRKHWFLATYYAVPLFLLKTGDKTQGAPRRFKKQGERFGPRTTFEKAAKEELHFTNLPMLSTPDSVERQQVDVVRAF